MPKLKRVRMRKRYKHTVNRKRLNKKKKKLPKIQCETIAEAWNPKQSVNQNLMEMGLSNDPNQSVKIPKTKEQIVKDEIKMVEEELAVKHRISVAKQLEQKSKERKRKGMRLPQTIVDKLGYYIEKYGDDYEAMTRDRMNYDQNTWKQLRAQIKKFMSIPEQWNEYWKKLDMEPPVRAVTVYTEEQMDSD